MGDGGGVSSFIHLHDAAAATVLALEHDGPAIYDIVDDDPAPARGWFRCSRRRSTVMMGTGAGGAWNAKAKRELGWPWATRAGDRDSPRRTRPLGAVVMEVTAAPLYTVPA